MPKPFFMVRPSGLFVRFLVPTDLRARVGSRFVVRRLHATQPDRARLAAARMGAALSDAFAQLRGGTMDDIDIKALLDKQRNGQLQELILRNVAIGNGTQIGEVEINNADDLALFNAMYGSRLKWKEDGADPTPQPWQPAAPSAPTLLLSTAIQSYKDKRKVANLTGDVDVNATLGIFLEMTGDKPLVKVDDDDVLAFEKATANWPKYARAKKRYQGLTAPQIVKDSQARQAARDPELELVSDHVRRKHRDVLAAFFNWAVKKKKISASPMVGDHRQQDHRIQRVQTRRPYRVDELERIFNPTTFDPWTEGRPQYYWAPWIALYTGARLNEIAQIYLNDIQTFHNIAGVAIGARRAGQSVKTGSSVRFVPFAKPLIDAGLMEYVSDVRDAGHNRLFPHLKYGDDFGDYLGDRFIVYLRSIGLKVEGNPDAPGMGFHWFRHTVGNAVVNTTTPLHTSASITGHGAKSILPGELSSYVQPAELRAKFRAVNKLKFPPPPKYERGSFNDALQAAHALPAKWARDDAARNRRKDAPVAAKQKAEPDKKPKDA